MVKLRSAQCCVTCLENCFEHGMLTRSRHENLLAVNGHILETDNATISGVRVTLLCARRNNGKDTTGEHQYARSCELTCLVRKKRAGTDGKDAMVKLHTLMRAHTQQDAVTNGQDAVVKLQTRSERLLVEKKEIPWSDA